MVDVLSTHVEVVRETEPIELGQLRALHARGGGPKQKRRRGRNLVCSPRTWRWSVVATVDALRAEVLSTHVEVVRLVASSVSTYSRALHARGGGPALGSTCTPSPACSPRTWRWSDTLICRRATADVLSTHVEVVRTASACQWCISGALHARGGGPLRCATTSTRDSVLSTHVEVVRCLRGRPRGAARALHARGGGPVLAGAFELTDQCSPRTWRWSGSSGCVRADRPVLSTHVEVVRDVQTEVEKEVRALHARGGGPRLMDMRHACMACSPRTWRWSAIPDRPCGAATVLSTHVEVVHSGTARARR